MTLALLDIVKTFCEEQGLPVPNTVIGNSDVGVVQMKALCNSVVMEMFRRWQWPSVRQEAVFTTIAGEDQGLIDTLCPNGFLWVINSTIYNRTAGMQFKGPLNPQTWQAGKAFSSSSSCYEYTFRRRHLLLDPPSPGGHICALEYASSYGIYDPVGLVFKERFTLDTDRLVVDYSILLAGLRYKWRQIKGLDYTEAMREFETLIHTMLSHDTPKPVLNLGDDTSIYKSGVVIPSGNWNISP